MAKLSYGNGQEGMLTLQSTVLVAEGIAKKVFTGNHTFPAAGLFTISYDGSNRNPAVNIENAVNTPLYIELALYINASVAINNTPIFKNPPQFFARAGEKFMDDYAAADTEGDSLAYFLVSPASVANYVNPAQVGGTGSNTFTIDASTGLITWDVPRYIGNYVFAVKVEEWRNGVKLSSILRDIQLTVTNDNPNYLPPTGSVSNPPQNSAEEKQFLLFPNPASGQAFMQLPNGGSAQTMEIWSSTGQLLKTRQLDALKDTHSLELGDLPRGMYAIKVKTVSRHFTSKLVVMH